MFSSPALVGSPRGPIRVGDVATASLQKLNDGQNDDIAMLRRRRAEEAEEAASVTGRPVWDTSTWMYVPSSLKGLKPSTSEPWARDGDVYSGGMSKYGVARPNYDPPQYVDVDSRTQDAMPRHVTLIENAMRCLLYTSPSPRDGLLSRMPSSA